MAVSRLLGTAAACVILFPFAAGHRSSYWSGCIKADFLNFGGSNFPLKIIFKMLQNHLFVALASRSGFGAAIFVVIMYRKASLCKNFFL